jgi:hypothetical protein
MLTIKCSRRALNALIVCCVDHRVGCQSGLDLSLQYFGMVNFDVNVTYLHPSFFYYR